MTTVIVPEYTPGTWLAVVTDGCVAVLPADADPATVRGLWESMRDDAGALSLVRHLQRLTRDGLTGLPPFALVSVADGRLHAVVRGEVEVEAQIAGHARVLSAPHVATWSEEVVEDVESVTVRVSGAPDDRDARRLPLLSGVVLVGSVHVALRDGATVPAATTGSPVSAEPVPARDDVAVPVPPGPAVPAPPAPLAVVVDDPFDHTLLRPRPADGLRAPSVAGDPDAELRLLLDGASLAAHVPATDVLVLDVPATADVGDGDPLPDLDLSTDHDGTTVLGSDVVALRDRLPDWAGHSVLAARTPVTAPAVHGVATVAGTPAGGVATVTAPARARLAMSTGERVPLNRPVLIGRAPQASRVHSTQVPRLVTVPSPMQDISRTHAEVRMDGDDVVLTDLRSTNGIVVVRCDLGPQRLQPGEPTVLVPGSLVDLGEGVTFTVERGA